MSAENLHRELAYAELALEVAAEDQERAAFRLRRAQIAVQEAKAAIREAERPCLA